MKKNELYNGFYLNFSENNIKYYNNDEYLNLDIESNFFIRNFCSDKNVFLDIDDYYYENDIKIINENIIINKNKLNSSINSKKYNKKNIAIIFGDGKNWNEIDKDIFDINAIKIGVNRSLLKHCENLNIYISNNPYHNSIECIPNFIKKFPDGLFTYKTSHKFIKKYKGCKYGYNIPNLSNNKIRLNPFNHKLCLEDHRNPYLAALSLCYFLEVDIVILVSCENSFIEQVPGSIYIDEGVYMYPQHIYNLSMISAGAYWLNNIGKKVLFYNSNIKIIEHMKSYCKKNIYKYINGENYE